MRDPSGFKEIVYSSRIIEVNGTLNLVFLAIAECKLKVKDVAKCKVAYCRF